MNKISIERYKRQILLPEIGLSGQEKLANSKVLVIGCGGLGSSVIPLLAAGGVGKLILCDADNIQLSNLNRQIIYKDKDIGHNKSLMAQEFVRYLNPDIIVEAAPIYILPKNFELYFERVDLVIDCTDRLATKLFIHDACITVNKPLIHSAAIAFTSQVVTILPNGRPCLRCFFEEQHMSNELNCANSGILGPILAVTGGIIVAEAIKYLIGFSINIVGKLQKIDLKNNKFNTYEFGANPNCTACGNNPTIDPYNLDNYESKSCF